MTGGIIEGIFIGKMAGNGYLASRIFLHHWKAIYAELFGLQLIAILKVHNTGWPGLKILRKYKQEPTKPTETDITFLI